MSERNEMSTLVMVRTVCCESYKEFGKRCGICPMRPENQAALSQYQQAVNCEGFGRRTSNAAELCTYQGDLVAEQQTSTRACPGSISAS